jgi:hypothetical protein
VTSISHVVLVSWKSGKQLHAEELVLPSIRGFLGAIPGVVAVVEGHSSSPEGLEDGYHYGFIVTIATRPGQKECAVRRPAVIRAVPAKKHLSHELSSLNEHLCYYFCLA